MTIRAHRLVAAGALTVAAVAAPIAIALSSADTTQVDAGCLAWYGSRDDGICLSYSNGNGMNVGTPGVGVGGSNSSGGFGVSTGPMLPGNSWNSPVR